MMRQPKRLALAVGMMFTLIALEFLWFGLLLTGCEGEPDALFGVSGDLLDGFVPCTVAQTRYPTTAEDMSGVYNGRTFYADGNHLGHDVLLAEGTPIHPIGCGIIRVYRPAKGYGDLVVVIEHKLGEPVTVTNGMGEPVTVASFLSIYGHVRAEDLEYEPGDVVQPDDVIGYVNDDAHNGDGAEHLHLGIRLQSAADAKATDVNWFRGYDTSPSQRKWFADPVHFLSALLSNASPVVWHPAGTTLFRPADGSVWMVGSGSRREPVDIATVNNERLLDRAVVTSDAELACMAIGPYYLSPRGGHALMKFDDAPAVYEYTGLGPGHWRMAFVSYEAFRSWGWSDGEIMVRPATEKNQFFSQTKDYGFRTMRDGSLVKAVGESEVAVVSGGERLPIVNWETFERMGYAAKHIYEVPQDTIDLVAGPRGAVITGDTIAHCAHPSTCVTDCPPASPGGGTGGGSAGLVQFDYTGPVLPGSLQFQGMWDPPGSGSYDWEPSTFSLCPDDVPGDGKLSCLLDMPSGTEDFLFQVALPDGSWWGDMSYDPQGGQGSPIGTVTLSGPDGSIPYIMVSNGTGPLYMNGYVASVP